ncbi:MAG: thiamine pyrophosphate-binding protein, partial [Acetobacteraceae bacterium]|nr:thiamine pyrophosphate-binding protein [Acetobacteraceae bacterium]
MDTPITQAGDAATAGRTVPVHRMLAEDIKSLGVDTAFGLMSDDTAVFVTSLDAIGVRFIGARHENQAVAMAEGYAAATGRLGVAVIGRGPATANGLHAAVYASRTGSPVLIVSGEAPVPGGNPNGLGPDYKAFNAAAVLADAGLRTFTATSAAAARGALADAAATANRGTAAVLLLPVNVQLAEVSLRSGDSSPVRPRAPRPPAAARAQAIAAAASVLERARRPLIIAGLGAHRAGARQALERLAERIGALLVTSLKGKDLFRGSPYDLGVIGSFSHSAGRRMIDQADCVLVFGAGLNLLTMSFGMSVPQGVPVIQVDAVRGNIGRWSSADVAVVGDAKLVAEQLTVALPARPASDKPFHGEEVRRALASFDIAADFQSAHTPRTVDPRALAVELDRLLPERRNVVYDAGNFLGVVPYLAVPDPGHLKITSDFASIGLGFGAALGFAKGRPDATTVLVVGDGGFLMTLGELETVAREDLPLVIVLMNDCAYGAELHFLKMRALPVAKSVFPDVDFAPVAEAFGFQAATVRTLDELRALAPVLAKPEGPVLLDCKINAA